MSRISVMLLAWALVGSLSSLAWTRGDGRNEAGILGGGAAGERYLHRGNGGRHRRGRHDLQKSLSSRPRK